MYQRIFKRLLDLLIVIVTLPFFFLLFIVVAPIIYFSDKGTIFYNSYRLGKKGKTFKMYKFRTMKMHSPDIRNDDGSTFSSSYDTRLTKIGGFLRKTSIDEIPQIINVLKGDMSIVGPRPDLPEHIEMYSECERKKLEVRPGITGLNQAYYRNAIPWKERIKNDIIYINKMSLFMDINIIFRTVIIIIKRDNVYTDRKGKPHDK
jgi:undecaprenyl phosphate N,N'-diacetylbacillosamine 1-phosphate transferase